MLSVVPKVTEHKKDLTQGVFHCLQKAESDLPNSVRDTECVALGTEKQR